MRIKVSSKAGYITASFGACTLTRFPSGGFYARISTVVDNVVYQFDGRSLQKWVDKKLVAASDENLLLTLRGVYSTFNGGSVLYMAMVEAIEEEPVAPKAAKAIGTATAAPAPAPVPAPVG